jgi:pimeloyl-ACP methyl ester carboxylesterase
MHGINQNEDGTFSWKFDNYVRAFPPYDLPQNEVENLWAAITCPTLLVYGKESWASDPRLDGRAQHLKTAEVRVFERAGHWVHHDRLDDFLALVTPFLSGRPLPDVAGVA